MASIVNDDDDDTGTVMDLRGCSLSLSLSDFAQICVLQLPGLLSRYDQEPSLFGSCGGNGLSLRGSTTFLTLSAGDITNRRMSATGDKAVVTRSSSNSTHVQRRKSSAAGVPYSYLQPHHNCIRSRVSNPSNSDDQNWLKNVDPD
ncbi:hypothetical protein ACOSP7_032537 [Xanthoceras sorbifolium]